jgi:hypothetical protein
VNYLHGFSDWVAAVFEHWHGWVSGGALAFFLEIGDRLKKWEIKPRIFAVVLIVGLFWSVFAAWRDEHQNTVTVINEKATAVGDLSTCNGDLKAETEKGKLWERLNGQQQATFNGQQATFNNQQDIVNKCIVALGSAIKPERLKIQDWFVGTVIEKTNREAPYFGSWIVLTNKTVTPIRLLVTCDGDIEGAGAEVLGTGGQESGGWGGKFSAKKYGIGITSPAWTPTNPLLVTVYANNKNLGRCTFEEQ